MRTKRVPSPFTAADTTARDGLRDRRVLLECTAAAIGGVTLSKETMGAVGLPVAPWMKVPRLPFVGYGQPSRFEGRAAARRIDREVTPARYFCARSTRGVITICLAALVVVCGVGASHLDPMSAVRLLIEAERAANLEAAVALFADDASITNVTGWKTADKEQLKWFISTEIWLRDRFQLDDLCVDGAKITWHEPATAPFYQRIGVAPVQFSFEAIVKDDKIKSIVAHLPGIEIARITEACKTHSREPLLYDRPCSEFVQLAEAHTKRISCGTSLSNTCSSASC